MSSITGAQGMFIVLLILSVLAILVWPPLAVVAVVGIALYVFLPSNEGLHTSCAMNPTETTSATTTVPRDVGEGIETYLRRAEAAKEEMDNRATSMEEMINSEIAEVNQEAQEAYQSRVDGTGRIPLSLNNAITEAYGRRERWAALIAPDTRYYKTYDPTGEREKYMSEKNEVDNFYRFQRGDMHLSDFQSF